MDVSRSRASQWSNFVGAEQTIDALLILCGASVQSKPTNSAVAQYLLASPNTVSRVAFLVESSRVTVVSVDQAVATNDQLISIGANTAEFCLKLRELNGRLGVIAGELHDVQENACEFVSGIKRAFENRSTHDATGFVSEWIMLNDDQGIHDLRMAGALCSGLCRKYIQTTLEQLLEATSPIELSPRKMADEIIERIRQPNLLPGFERLNNESGKFATWDLPPAHVQNGHISLDPEFWSSPTELNTNPIRLGEVLTVSYGARCHGFHAYIARSYLVGPVDKLTEKTFTTAYDLVCGVLEHIETNLLKVGSTFGDVYRGSLEFAKAKNSDLASGLTAELGVPLGLLVGNQSQCIKEESTRKIVPGMVLAIRIGFNISKIGDGRSLSAGNGILLADSFAVHADSSVQHLTNAPRDEFRIQIKERESVSQIKPRSSMRENVPMPETQRHQMREKVLESKRQAWIQAGSPKGIPEPASGSRLASIPVTELRRLATGDIVCTSSTTTQDTLLVDRDADALVVPLSLIPGLQDSKGLVSFHVSTIRKVGITEQTGHEKTFELSVEFHHIQQASPAFTLYPHACFFRELTFISSGTVTPLVKIKTALSQIMATIAQRDVIHKQQHGIVPQGQLQRSSNPINLPQVRARPTPLKGRGAMIAEGTLEAHSNGFRYVMTVGIDIVILYSNISMIIVQPSENDPLVILHLVLKAPIALPNNRKVENLQFVADVLAVSEQVKRTRSMTDEQEVDMVERDRERIELTNRQFRIFAEAVGQRHGVRIEQPKGDVCFEGSPGNSIANFYASEHVLWSVSDLPFWVVDAANIEVVSFERVIHGQQTVDVVFVYKDYYTTKVINSVPFNDMGILSDWLLSADLLYFETATNLNWKNLLTELRNDPNWEPWSEEGWEVFFGEDDEEEEESESESEPESEESDESDFHSDSAEDEFVETDDESGEVSEEDTESDESEDIAPRKRRREY